MWVSYIQSGPLIVNPRGPCYHVHITRTQYQANLLQFSYYEFEFMMFIIRRLFWFSISDPDCNYIVSFGWYTLNNNVQLYWNYYVVDKFNNCRIINELLFLKSVYCERKVHNKRTFVHIK